MEAATRRVQDVIRKHADLKNPLNSMYRTMPDTFPKLPNIYQGSPNWRETGGGVLEVLHNLGYHDMS